jgi:hypothetical protein
MNRCSLESHPTRSRSVAGFFLALWDSFGPSGIWIAFDRAAAATEEMKVAAAPSAPRSGRVAEKKQRSGEGDKEVVRWGTMVRDGWS